MPRRRPSRPLSPEATAVVRAMARSAGAGPSRRSVLGGAGALGIGALLAACGSDSGGLTSTSAQGGPAPAKDLSASEKVVNWANWTLYLDKSDDGKTYPTLDAFQKKTGIKPAYEEVIEDNDSYYAKVQAQLHKGQDIGADVVVLTDWMASRLIREGLVQAFDQGSMPNTKNLIPALRDVSYDPGRKHSITWQSGFAGIAYNKEKVSKPVNTVDDLWRSDLKGGVEVLTEWRDTLGLIMRSQGVDITKPFTLHTFDNALQVLQKNLADGQIRQVKGNSYKEDLISGDAVAVMAWSGDIFQLNNENGDKWRFVQPASGGTLFSDNLMIPIGAPHKKNAETLIDYYYDPKVAAEVAAYVNYICPVQGAKEEMKKIDKGLAASPLIFPSEAELNNTQVFTKLDPTLETLCTEAFESTLGL